MRRGKAILLLMMTLTIVFLVAGCGKKKDAVATVNGEAITKTQLEERFNELKEYAKSQGFDPESPTHAPMLGDMKKDALDNLIQEALLNQAARDKKIGVTDQQVEDQLKTMKGQMSQEQFQEALKAQGITEVQLKDRLRMLMTQDALYKQLTDDVKIESAQLESYYQESKDDLVKLKVSHILFLAKEGEATEAQVAQAKTKALDVIKKLETGADFATLAKAQSQDEGSAQEGGLMDYYFTREDPYFVPEFVAGAFLLEKGAFSREPVQSPFGFHVIRVEDKKESFDELKDEIEATLLGEEKNKRFSEFYDQLESKAKIIRNLPEEKAPAEGKAQEAPTGDQAQPNDAGNKDQTGGSGNK